MVIHDATVDRTTDASGLVKDLTWAQLQRADAGVKHSLAFAHERVPLLEERKKTESDSNTRDGYCFGIDPGGTILGNKPGICGCFLFPPPALSLSLASAIRLLWVKVGDVVGIQTSWSANLQGHPSQLCNKS